MIRASLRLAAAACALAAAAPAAAQEAREFTLERLRVTADRSGIVGVEWGDTLAHLAWDVALWGTFEDDPLVVRRADGDRLGSLVHRRAGGALVGAIGLGGRLQLGLELPLVLYQARDADQPAIATGPLDELGAVGFGDVRLLPKLRVFRGLALVVGIALPSGQGEYRGGKAVELQPELAISRRQGRLRLAGNLGYRMRDDQEFLGQAIEDELTGRAGVAVTIARGVEVASALELATAAASPFEVGNQHHAELLGQLAIALGARGLAFAGGGAGLSEGYGAPDWRVFAGVRFAGSSRPAPRPLPPPPIAPASQPVPPAPAPPPPPPPIDSDGDGLLDPDDRCPHDAEDPDGFEDADGCPDVDNDRDGITDTRDNCPNEAGPEENAGCQAKQRVAIGEGKLEILEAVYFQTNKAVIEPRSFPLLDDVARVILAHPEVGVVRVEGHTDDRGPDDENLELSQRRAQAVKDYLVGKGVPAERLEPRGYGETQPIGPNKTARDRAANRRVVFAFD